MINNFRKSKQANGFTLVEMLVVILIFAIIGTLATQTLVLSLKASRKSESLVRVKQSVEYSLSFMERALRTSKELVGCTSPTTLQFLDSSDEIKYFHCDGTNQLIETDYATTTPTQITSPDVHITNCASMFICDITSTPDSVNITIEAEDATVTGAEGAYVNSSTRILMRNY